jgi:shikimate dehydrogenase
MAGVLGWPVSHSRSPRLHNFWLRRYGIDGAYVPLPTLREDFGTAVQGLRAAGFAGANVTIPHKEAAFRLCDTLLESAQRAGAVNTLTFTASGIVGSNTDMYGFLANLRAHGVTATGPALVLGAGGAARAVAAALLQAGASVTISNRTHARATALAAELPGLRVVDWDDRERALADQVLLVNTTSLGMEGHAALAMDLRHAQAGLAVADIVYAPQETPLLHDARACGFVAVPGLGMLVHQAVPGFEAWFGVRPEVDDEVFAAISMA